MKTPSIYRMTVGLLAAAVTFTGISCTTTYDSQGRPVESVDPGVAVAGAAAAGILGYAVASDRQKNRNYRRNHHYRPRYHRRGHYYYR